MKTQYSGQKILLITLILIPLNSVMAESFVDSLLRFTGISITTKQVRGSFITGNIWLINLNQADTNKAKQITNNKSYHSPLWIPGAKDKLIAINEDKQLVRLNVQGVEEKILHQLTHFTVLLGFDKNDSDSVLILQGESPTVLRLGTGQIKLLPYDKNNSVDTDALDRLMSNFRDYGETQVFIENQSQVDASGHFNQINKIHIKNAEKSMEISCLAECAQPALNSLKNRLVFIDQ